MLYPRKKKMRMKKKLRLQELTEGLLEEVVLLIKELVREYINNVGRTDLCKGNETLKWLIVWETCGGRSQCVGINLSVYKTGKYTIFHGANSGSAATQWPDSSYQGDHKIM